MSRVAADQAPYAAPGARAQAFTAALPISANLAGQGGVSDPMLGIALISFIGLFAFGAQLLGWHDTHGQVQMGLFMSFLFGIVCGFRARG
jgi:hypothetical protein